MALPNLYSRLSLRTISLFERAKMTEHTFMITVAIIIGILAGFSAIGIRWLIRTISLISFPGAGSFLDNVLAAPWYLILLAPLLGGIIVGPLIYFFAPEAKGHGVPEVMQAILQKGGNIRPRVAIIKAFASAVSIGTGGSVGREGPIIQIGSSLGSTVGQFLRIPSARLKTLVGCGAGAGIAAAFNAPIAGALFAVEIILMDFAVAQFSPIVISSVMATVISHTFEGNFAAFRVPVYQLASPFEIGLYFILGALAGVVSFLFIKLLYLFEDFFDNKLPVPEYVKPAIGGLGVGAIALLFPEIMGVGYDSINIALHGDMIWYLGAVLVLVKILATSVTLGSGGSGGIFAPSLFMGAMLGSFFGSFVHHLFPDSTASAGAYALVAMGGLVAGTTRAPITAIIIVFELTNDYRIILPLMITCIISTILSSKFSRESIYTLKLLLRNIGIREGKEINVMEGIFVKDVFSRQFDAIPVTANFSQVVKTVLHGKDPSFPVVNAEGALVGILSIDDIKDHLFERDSLSSLLIAGDIAVTSIRTVTPDEHCQDALEKMSLSNSTGIPVVENKHSRVIIGMIWRKDILEAYQKEIDRRELTSTLASSITMKEGEEQVHFMEGYSITEMQPPQSFIGKSIGELDIRGKFGVDVLSVRSGKDGETINALPGAAYVIRENDLLIIAGEIRRIAVLRALN